MRWINDCTLSIDPPILNFIVVNNHLINKYERCPLKKKSPWQLPMGAVLGLGETSEALALGPNYKGVLKTSVSKVNNNLMQHHKIKISVKY